MASGRNYTSLENASAGSGAGPAMPRCRHGATGALEETFGGQEWRRSSRLTESHGPVGLLPGAGGRQPGKRVCRATIWKRHYWYRKTHLRVRTRPGRMPAVLCPRSRHLRSRRHSRCCRHGRPSGAIVLTDPPMQLYNHVRQHPLPTAYFSYIDFQPAVSPSCACVHDHKLKLDSARAQRQGMGRATALRVRWCRRRLAPAHCHVLAAIAWPHCGTPVGPACHRRRASDFGP
jgi:hypothetical protein